MGEVLLRRLPPDVPPESSIVQILDGTFRAVSGRMCPRPGEDGLSCSRAAITTPADLLALIGDPPGWMVCEFPADALDGIGLALIPKPTPEDAGHCIVVTKDGAPFGRSAQRKLARITRVLSPEKIATWG